MGCSLKCVDTCFQFAKGLAAVQCTQQCGCKDLLTPVQSTELMSDFSIEISTPKSANDDWDIDITLGQEEDKNINIEAGKTQIDENTSKTHVEVDVSGGDPDSKEIAYEKVEGTDETGTVEASHSEWSTIGGELDGSSDEVVVKTENGGYQEGYKAELPNVGITVEYGEVKEVTPTEDGVVVDHANGLDVKQTGTDYDGNEHTQEVVIEQGHELTFNQTENGGEVGVEGGLEWQTISTVNIQPEFSSEKIVKTVVTKSQTKSAGVWGWAISFIILAIALAIFYKKVAGNKRKVVEYAEPEFNYIRI